MNSELLKKEEFEQMSEVGDSDLAEVSGGLLIGDGFCGTPVPHLPRPLPGPSTFVNPQPLPPAETLMI